jgi:hypothetical protein
LSGIILPDRVRIQMEFDDHLSKLDGRHDWLRRFDAELRALDPYLSLVKAQDNATQLGLTPGYWHVKRDNPTTIPTFIALRGPDGEFVEPSSAHLEMLRRSDLQRKGAFDELVKRHDAAAAKAAKLKETQREERVDHMAEIIAHHDNASVSMAEGWTNSAKGRKA